MNSFLPLKHTIMQTFPVFGFTSIRQIVSRLTRNRMGAYGYRASLLSVLLVLALSSLSLGQSLSVSMSYPAFRSSFITGSQVNIQTTTTTPASTTVTKVEFFLATFTGPGNSKVTVKLGEDLSAPFSYTWTIPDGQVSYNELSAVVTNTTGATAVQGGTGYIRVDVYPPNTNSNKKYYVQASASATNTAGTLAAPFNTIQKAADVVQPGDSVFVMAGTYTNTGTGDVVILRRTGTPAHWIVFTNYQTDRPKLSFNGWQGINLTPGAAYIKIQGFEVEGNNGNVTLAEAQQQPGACEGPNPTAIGSSLAKFNGNGISVSGRTGGNFRPHHIVIANNVVHDCGGAGISAIESDYITVENNTVYNNSWYTIFGASGISVLNSWNYDNSTDVKMIIRNNRCYANRLFIRWNNGGLCKITDGNGIILDNNNDKYSANPLGAYTGQFLIENNLTYLNGGRGINVNYSDNVTVLNNTTYQNAVSPEISSELVVGGSKNDRIYNNIFYGRADRAINVVSNSSDILHNNNLTFGGTGTPYFSGDQNKVGLDPQFVDAAGGNFQLSSTSPALNAGSSTAGQYALKDILGISRPQGSGVDMGAYELQGATLSITQQPASSSVVCAGASVSVSVGTEGTVQGYQWYKDGNALTGVTSATTATLSLSAVTIADQGNYSVVVSGSISLTSSAFSLTVNAPPTVSIAANPSLTATTGSSVTLTASGADTYRWNTGVTTAVLSASTAATYSVTGTTANGCSATATATVIQLAPPSASMPFPQFNSSYISGTDINIQATATTPAGTSITKVEFFYDAAFSGTYTKIGEDLTAPYSIIWTAPAVPANGRSYQLRAVVTNSASTTAIQSGTGYNGISVYPASYISTRNWYVSASASAANTAGTEVLPFNTIQKAADRVAPGDTVFVMAGTYSNTSTNVVGIQRTGTASKWIVFMPYKTDKPVLALGNNNWQAFNVLPAAAYIKIQGFEIIGNNANITLAQAQAQPGACEGSSPAATPTARFNGNGISVLGRSGGNLRPHHVVLANNYIHDCAGGGISVIEADYVTIEDNITANTSWYTVYGTSGISVFNSWNYDNNTTTPRMIIRRNRSFGNILKIAWNIGGTGTNCKFYDGNGIILDNNRGADPNNANAIKNALGDFTGKFLVENNICYKNGGRGININYSDNATIINNTTYQNGQSDGSFGIGIDNEFIMQGSIGARIFNNIFYGKPGENPSSVSGSSDVQQNNNLTFSNAGNGYFTNNQNIVGQDPQFVDAATGDFRLASTSPAINAGSSTAGQYASKDILSIDRPQGSGVDIGAYEFQGTPISFSQQPASSSAVCVGANVSTSVVVNGPVQAYQWYKDGSALTGVTSATTATLSLSAVTSADQGNYYVVVTGFNSLTSSSFSLTINTPPTASLAASGAISCTTSIVTLTATSGSNVTYSFGNGATQIGMGNTATVSQAGTYTVLVTSAGGCYAWASVDVSGSLATPDAPNVSSVSATQGAGNVTLSVSNCAGTVNWNGADGSNSLVVSTSAVGEFVYSVTCKVGVCVSPVTSVTVSVKALPATLSVSYRDGDNNQPTNNVIRPYLKLNNEGNTAVSYGDITIRYWLTVEDFAPLTNLSVYWAQLGTSKVRMRYVPLTQPRQGAFGYIEYSFDASAGTLGAGSNSDEIQTGVGKQNWTNVSESDDYSFAPTAVYTKTDRITIYKNGVLVGGVEPVAIAPVTSLKVYSENKNSSSTTNQISTYLKLANSGNVAVDYSQLTVRYWFSAEGTNPLVYNLDYAELGNGNIKSKFVKENRAGTDTYLELSFVPTLGQLNPLSSTGIIQQRINKSDWSNFNEANDYSYKPAGALAENTKITAYLNGSLVYGQEPGPVGARLGVEPSGLRVVVLGNPIEGDAVHLDVTGVEGQSLYTELIDSRGQLVTKHQVEQAATSEHIRLPVGRSSAGVLVLRVSTLTESQTLKLVKP
jgi:parallel beta-helix repeat protein